MPSLTAAPLVPAADAAVVDRIRLGDSRIRGRAAAQQLLELAGKEPVVGLVVGDPKRCDVASLAAEREAAAARCAQAGECRSRTRWPLSNLD